MLKITVSLGEAFDEATQKFIDAEFFELELEHSLVSVSKWESKFKVPFLTDKPKTAEEVLWYVQAMCLTPNIAPEIFLNLSTQNIADINAYISDSMTATWFAEEQKKANREVVTSELIYYWMIALNIPFECQYWHLNRLLTLIKVCNEKNKPPKKMSRNEARHRQRSLNKQRQIAWATKG